MERVKTILAKLQSQMEQGNGATDLLVTVKMLESELLHLKEITVNVDKSSSIIINLPNNFEKAEKIEESKDAKVDESKKMIEVLQVNEDEINAELEEIKNAAQERERMIKMNKPKLLFDPIEDIPTLYHQQPNSIKPIKEINEVVGVPNDKTSLNETLKVQKIEHKRQVEG